MTFKELDLIEPILKALQQTGYTTPTPIQEQAIPVLLKGKDLLGCAQTGTGKTAAFAIPLIQRLYQSDHKKGIKALILTPTRELAIQIGENFDQYAKYTGVKHAVIFGGVPQKAQVDALKRGVQVLIATPGRLLDLQSQGCISLKGLEYFVLDEADRMLDMGFIHDIKKVLKLIPARRQTLFFSATMPSEIEKLADSMLTNPKKVEVTPVSSTVDTIQQSVYFVEKKEKKDLLLHLLKNPEIESVLIFTRTKHGADKLAKILNKSEIGAEAIHGNKSQNARQRALTNFKDHTTRVLIATDIAARGIDVDDVEAVINYDIPQDIEYYVHRIGRTGRAGRKGRSFTFANSREIYKIREIERVCHTTITEKKLPGAAKVLKAKADKYLNKAWELHEHEDIELMKSFLQRKMEEEGCDALELAAAMLKLQVGDKGEEIAADEYTKRGNRFGDRGRSGRDDGEGRSFGRGDGRRRFGRGDRDRRDNGSTGSGEDRRRRRSDSREDGRKWNDRDRKNADRKLSAERAEREAKKRKKREEPGIGNSFPKRKRS